MLSHQQQSIACIEDIPGCLGYVQNFAVAVHGDDGEIDCLNRSAQQRPFHPRGLKRFVKCERAFDMRLKNRKQRYRLRVEGAGAVWSASCRFLPSCLLPIPRVSLRNGGPSPEAA